MTLAEQRQRSNTRSWKRWPMRHVERQPDWVVRVSVNHAERLMVEAKSKNYPLAAAWLKRAKAAYQRLGQTVEWQLIWRSIKEQYKRRPRCRRS